MAAAEVRPLGRPEPAPDPARAAFAPEPARVGEVEVRVTPDPCGGVVAAQTARPEIVPAPVARVAGVPVAPAARHRGAVAPASTAFRAIPDPGGSEGRVASRGAIGPAEVAKGEPTTRPTPEAPS